MSRRVHFVMPDELIDRIDTALAEGQSRGAFVRAAVERALSAEPTGATAIDRKSPGGSAVASPVEARPAAPAEPPLSRADAFRKATQRQ